MVDLIISFEVDCLVVFGDSWNLFQEEEEFQESALTLQTLPWLVV